MELVFDIGGTHIRRGVLSGDTFKLLDKHPTTDLQNRLEELIASALPMGIDRIGISFAGQVDKGVILSAPNIDLGTLAGCSIPAWIQQRFDLPAAIDNDLKCAALAEAACYPDAKALAVLYIGTGFGGALVQNGQLIRGCGNQAGEIGHIPFEKAPFVCGCGKEDCLELSTSGSAITRWAHHLGLGDQNLTTIAAQRHENPKAAEIYDRFLRGLRHSLQTIAPLFNPDRIILGGGVIHHNPWLLSTAQEALRQAFKPTSGGEVRLSTLADEANLMGASRL